MTLRLKPVSGFIPFKEKAYQAIKEAIIFQRFQENEFLSEKELAKQLGVSRTPVREALSRLAQEGLVRIIPQKGTFVTSLSFEDAWEICQIREALEGMAARLAAPKVNLDELAKIEHVYASLEDALKSNDYAKTFQADVDLHNFVMETAGNQRIITIISQLNAQIHRVRLAAITSPERNRETFIEHLEIIAALKKRDPVLAEQAMVQHLRKVAENMSAIFQRLRGNP